MRRVQDLQGEAAPEQVMLDRVDVRDAAPPEVLRGAVGRAGEQRRKVRRREGWVHRSVLYPSGALSGLLRQSTP